jgi:hypothetical protein
VPLCVRREPRYSRQVLRGLLFAAVAALALALAPAGVAGGPTMRVGAAEDFVKGKTLVEARAKMTLARLAGFDTIRITAIWAPGETEPSDTEAAVIKNAADAARLSGIELVVAVYHRGSRTTPLTEEHRAEFAQFAAAVARANPSLRHFVIGNEPNLNGFWMPQFNEDGTSASPAAYLPLLAETYDALKDVSPRIVVAGVALSPRGGDNPALARHTHSPTRFLRELGAAYKASERTRPIMDQLAIHPYGTNSSQAPQDQVHPRTTTIAIGDYEKLVALLAEAFDGTPQPGATLPILYSEYGIESLIPASKADLYTGAEPTTTRPVPEATQGAYYRQAIGMAFCQPNVVGILLFHVADEPGLPQWQSGVYYVDGTPKTSLPAVRRAAEESRRGVVARCPDLKLTPRFVRRAWPSGSALRADGPLRTTFVCTIDCAWRLELVASAGGKVVKQATGRAVGRRATQAVLPPRRVAPGRYRLRLTLTAPVNPGSPFRVMSPVLLLR